MMRGVAATAMTLAIAACHATPEPPTTRLDRVQAYIFERLDPAHPSRGPMLIYASSVEHMVETPDDMEAMRRTMVASSCLGLHEKGSLVDDTRAAVNGMLFDTPERLKTYRRYVVASSSMAMTPEESRCME